MYVPFVVNNEYIHVCSVCGQQRIHTCMFRLWLTTNTYMYIPFVVNNEYIICYSAIRQGIYMVFIWLMSNEDNFIINQLSDMILKLHSSRNDIIQN